MVCEKQKGSVLRLKRSDDSKTLLRSLVWRLVNSLCGGKTLTVREAQKKKETQITLRLNVFVAWHLYSGLSSLVGERPSQHAWTEVPQSLRFRVLVLGFVTKQVGNRRLSQGITEVPAKLFGKRCGLLESTHIRDNLAL